MQLRRARDLPMRDGNTGKRQMESWLPLARDLPMRDGNFRKQLKKRRPKEPATFL